MPESAQSHPYAPQDGLMPTIIQPIPIMVSVSCIGALSLHPSPLDPTPFVDLDPIWELGTTTTTCGDVPKTLSAMVIFSFSCPHLMSQQALYLLHLLAISMKTTVPLGPLSLYVNHYPLGFNIIDMLCAQVFHLCSFHLPVALSSLLVLSDNNFNSILYLHFNYWQWKETHKPIQEPQPDCNPANPPDMNPSAWVLDLVGRGYGSDPWYPQEYPCQCLAMVSDCKFFSVSIL